MATITRAVRLAHPRAAVWAALTDPDALADWLMPNDFVPQVGHRFTFWTDPAPGFDGTVQSEVLELVAPERLVLAWVAGAVDTRVTFRLEDAGEATILHLRHEGFSLRQFPVRLILGKGWRQLLTKRLPDHLARRATPPPSHP
ncbi:MAG: SRPBCC domain-containing protein [Pseudomonadota bacterium]